MSLIGQLIQATEQLRVEQCYKCQCLFAIPMDLYKRARIDSNVSFYCPHGHGQSYTKSEVSVLKEQLESKERQLQWKQEQIESKNRQIKQLDYSVRAQKAAKTKILNRVKNGVCPCCNRSFQNLQNHFKIKHPELLNDAA